MYIISVVYNRLTVIQESIMINQLEEENETLVKHR